MLSLPISDKHRLRPLQESDAVELYALIDRNRAQLRCWMPWAAGQTLQATEIFIGKSLKQLVDNNGFQTAILEREEIIGMVGYHGVDWGSRSTSLGYWLDHDHQGQGTMTKAVRTLVSHGFSDWELNRIEIRAAVENRRSRAIPERLGFRNEATLREAERVGDRNLDMVVYATLASEWSAQRD